jgi:DNA-binding CsgD family transcriptional regulator
VGGKLPDAAGLMTQAAEMSVELGERAAEGAAHLFLGLQQMFAGAPDKGRGHLTTARAVYQETGDLIGEGRSTAALGLSCFMDDENRLWRSGSRLTVDEAIALAFGTTPTDTSRSSARRPRAEHALGISTREIDVVRLVAEGLSNKEIAGRLHLSVRTVESHVPNVLTKTGLVNRTQLATWARERGE